MPDPTFRLTLRQLPLPVKLVLSVFLCAVGLGYFSAMVQLHMKHSSMEGNPLPSPTDVIERFSKYQPFDGTFPKSKVEALISGDHETGWGKANMTPAFFAKSGGWDTEVKKRDRKVVEAERETERRAMIAWINTAVDERKKAYDDDKFPLPKELDGKPITDAHFDKDTKTVSIKTVIGERCGSCHPGDQQPDLGDWKILEPLVTAPKPEVFDSGGKQWVTSSKQMSLDGLTQSTHAHLLSFAVLFTLTGLVFAFTSYPSLIRGTLGPIVLLAQVADIACWWLARLDLPYGPTFALAIMGTGAVVGVGLALQIILSLFNMYGAKGKVVLVLLFLAAGTGFGVLYQQAIRPALDAEKEKATTRVQG